ncbi:MAG: sodium/solute symporter [Aureliella sp.]
MVAFAIFGQCSTSWAQGEPSEARFSWEALQPLPDELGVAGPVVGVHRDKLLVAGGANFPRPVWENEKQWKREIYWLDLKGDTGWTAAGELPYKVAYSACASLPVGILRIGGNDGDRSLDSVQLVAIDKDGELAFTEYPTLPQPCAYAQAAVVGDYVYVCGGQSGNELSSAMDQLWRLRWSQPGVAESGKWEVLESCPGGKRAFNIVCSQHNGYETSVYVVSGRRASQSVEGGVEFLTDCWEYQPSKQKWRRRTDVNRCVMAAAAAPVGQSHIVVLGGADGTLFDRSDALRDKHPGFPKEAMLYHAITDRWVTAGAIPSNQVTTTAVRYKDHILLPTGETRPRVRTPAVWRIKAVSPSKSFGAVNYAVLGTYLFAMLLVGVYFARRARSTDDYFRGGSRIPWWAAGCSIFATMLSSLTFTGIPSKAFAQDWVYAIGNFMIPMVAFVGVFVALPFYRKIDATSAYEYLEKRFSRPVRLFGSLSFSLFHVFRMAVVLSLTGLGLAVATPLSPAQSVLLMGVLSIAYCTLGGIEAVIWTDTIQTVVLLGGASLAIILLVMGTDGGFSGMFSAATAADKFRLANFHFDATSAQLALWVVVLGALGQNLSSYTADQAVVQRYMTTADERLAARSIWTNAVMTIPATLLFFGIGTCLFAFYQSHPERLEPTATTDQIFPLFIAREMPIGLAGLIVAGIFSAAQSTVSTSMNSTATTLITDFARPINVIKSEEGYLRAARRLTVLMGAAGTTLGLVFIDPSIRSLFDTFIRVIGLFMGVLGGLFVLGAATRRANSIGAIVGVLAGVSVMVYVWQFSAIQGYLYPAIGLTVCFAVGYVVSRLFGKAPPLSGLTIYG